MGRKRVIIMGAAGRDFHNFNLLFRDNTTYEVVAFTAAQIPNIENRIYPPELAGKLYPNGIPIYPEAEIPTLIKKYNVDIVVFSYSDVSHQYVMERASKVLSAGANFMLLGPQDTMLKSHLPVISITATRTGSGKSQTTRKVANLLKSHGKNVVIVRHPMPYGNLRKQITQRFASLDDLDRHNCTIEEREEYEPHINNGIVVYAGIDYGQILHEAESEADIIIWDGGNNDLPFFKPDLSIVVTDPHRPGNEISYYPGLVNLLLADVVIVNKIDSARWSDIQTVLKNIKKYNPRATVIEAASPIFVEHPDRIKDKAVLVVEDGPTLTHGEMPYGAGVIAAQKYGAREIIDPRPYAKGSIKQTFAKYTHIGSLLPAMGYSEIQIKELAATINSIPYETLIIATPIDLRRLISIDKPSCRVKYELEEIGYPKLDDVLRPFYAQPG